MTTEHDGELPPLTLDDVVDAVSEPGSAAYLYFGPTDDDDVGYQNALLVRAGFADLSLFVATHAAAKDWVDGKRPRGLVVGHEGKPRIPCDKRTAEDIVQLTILINGVIQGM